MGYMHEIKEMLCEELEKFAKKGELTTGSLDAIDKLTHSIKSIATVLAMEESGYSNDGSYDDGSYRSYRDGGSYRRGRSMTTGRDAGYSREYSREGGMREKLEELMEQAPDDHTRQELQRLINKM